MKKYAPQFCELKMEQLRVKYFCSFCFGLCKNNALLTRFSTGVHWIQAVKLFVMPLLPQ